MMVAFQADKTIDLHGLSPDAAEEYVRRTIESGRFRGKTVMVIHGCGRGILRERIRAWGQHSKLVKKIWTGEDFFLAGGGGITVFFL